MMKRRGLLGAFGSVGAALGLGATAQASTAIPLPPAPKGHRNGMTDRQIAALRDEVIKRVRRYDAWSMPDYGEEQLDYSLTSQSDEDQDRQIAHWKRTSPDRWKKQKRLLDAHRRWAPKNEAAWAKRIKTTGLVREESSYVGPLAEHQYARGISEIESEGAKPVLIVIGPRRLKDLMPLTFAHFDLCHPDDLVRAWLWERPVVVDPTPGGESVVFVGKQGNDFKMIRFAVYE
jgi:hypothetical protein